MWYEFVPYCCGAMLINCAETCYAVIFEGLYGPFCCIYSMIVGLHKLDFDVLLFQVSLNCFACNIIYDVKHWSESTFGQICDILPECLNNGVLFCIRDRGC